MNRISTLCSALILGMSTVCMADSATQPKGDVSSEINKLNQQIQSQLKEMHTTFQQQVNTLNTKTEKQIQDIQKSLQDQIQTLKKQTDTQMQQLKTSLEGQIQQINKK